MWGLLHTHFPSLPLGTDFGTHWVFFFFFFLSGDCSSVLLDTGAPGAFIKTQFKESQFIAFILPNKIKWVVSHQWSLRKITFGKWAHLPEECSRTGLIQIGESLPLRQEAVGFQSFMLAAEPYAWWMMICKVSWGVFGVFFFLVTSAHLSIHHPASVRSGLVEIRGLIQGHVTPKWQSQVAQLWWHLLSSRQHLCPHLKTLWTSRVAHW